MIFLVILVALMLERFFHWHHLRHWRWVYRYEAALTRRLHLPALVVWLITLGLPVIVVGLIHYLLRHWLYGIPDFIFNVIILLYCLGPENLWVQAYQVLAWLNKNDPDAATKTQKMFDLPEENAKSLVGTLFIAANKRLFAVLFWFVLLGPMGAFLYRLNDLLSKQVTTPVALKCQSYLDWIPARLFAFLFALGGHFTEVFHLWKQYALRGVDVNEKLLVETGLAALDIQTNQPLTENGLAIHAALSLLDRVFLIALFLLAMFVIIFI